MSSFFKAPKKKGAPMRPRVNDRLRNAAGKLQERSLGINLRATTPQPMPAQSSKPSSSNNSRSCPNKQCPNPQAPVEDGYCSACGREIDTSNIVSEVTFGESSTGAAVVQGTFVGADQGALRSLGPGMRRMGGSVGETKERIIREAKQMMQQYAQQLRISETVVNEAVQIFKVCLGQNWIQGRGMLKVVPVCFYTACRRQERCKIMLIDLAELVKINVYELGHVFTDLADIYDFGNSGIKPVIPEDLIYRFADKLDFGDLTKEVAELATKLCVRMGYDWMQSGRRPSGICGACLQMAAQVWGFRRTTMEVTCVVKVTCATIETRLAEFREVETSDMTIEDFLNKEFLQSQHDPPSYYRHLPEWQERVRKRDEANGIVPKQKRKIEDIEEVEENPSRQGSPDGQDDTGAASRPSKRTKMGPPPLPPPDMSKLPKPSQYMKKSVDPETGKTNFEPFDRDDVPSAPPKTTVDQDMMDFTDAVDIDDTMGEDAIDHVAENYGDESKKKSGRGRYTRKPYQPVLNFNQEWEDDEKLLAQQITEVINDPSSNEHRKAVATAAYSARIKAAWARKNESQTEPVSMSETISPDEFLDDPEVENCLLDPDEIAAKEQIWMNNNKDWMRRMQDREYKAAREKVGPPKKKRNRKTKPRIGEGQAGPANSAGEAAAEMMQRRGISSRLNLKAIEGLFIKNNKAGPGSVVESSRAASEAPSQVDNEQEKAVKQVDDQAEEEEEVEEPYTEGYDLDDEVPEEYYDEDDDEGNAGYDDDY